MSDQPTVCKHGSLRRQCEPCGLEVELAEVREELTDWILVADGVKHDWRCTQDARTGGDGSGMICLRCQLEQAEARVTALTQELEQWRGYAAVLRTHGLTVPKGDT